MKKITFILLVFILGMTTYAQTAIFTDAAGTGVTLPTPDNIVANPLSDAVNSSASCIESDAPGAWQGYEILCNVPVTAANHIFSISLYNPDANTELQVQCHYNDLSDAGLQQWHTVTYPAGANAGWVEVTIDLSDRIGEDLTWLWIAPTA